MKLSLILPGLADVVATRQPYHTPVFGRWLGRSVLSASDNLCFEQSVLHALGQSGITAAELPGAQCTFLQDFGGSPPPHCARADPVYLKAERDDARLIPAESLQLTAAESSAIFAALNSHFAEDGLRFLQGEHARWYITGADAGELAALPTSQIAGRNVSAFLPTPAQAPRWLQISTEVQMLLHTLDINESRVLEGKFPVNALWFWGNGKLKLPEQAVTATLYANTAFATGVGRLLGAEVLPLQEIVAALPSKRVKHVRSMAPGSHAAQHIIVDTSLLDAVLDASEDDQHQCLLELEHGLLTHITKWVMRGVLSSAELDCCDGRSFTITRGSLMQFWKKPQTLGPSNWAGEA